MADGKRVQHIRHVEASAEAFEGLEGEVTVNLTNSAARVHDGVTPGGHEQALASLANVEAATTGQDGKMTAAQVAQQNTNTADIATNAADILAKGVTNGDTHNHSGGDGATITSSALGTNAVIESKILNSAVTVNKLDNEAVTGVKISKSFTDITQTISALTNWTPSARIMQGCTYMSGTYNLRLGYYNTLFTNWKYATFTEDSNFLIICDGSKVRFENLAIYSSVIYGHTI